MTDGRQGRRATLLGLGAWALAPAWPAAGAVAAEIVVQAGPGSGRIAVINRSSAAQALRRKIIVAGDYPDGWRPLFTEFHLVRACEGDGVIPQGPACIMLAPGETVRPPPWLGFSCMGQCEGHCRANIYYGSGPFRFEVGGCDGRTFFSEPFMMPRQPDGR